MIPGYVSDHFHTPDKLGIDGPAAILSSMIADRATQSPLSVGIIGSPGTGKTFFIRRMQQRISELATAALSLEQEGLNTRYCSHIVQINFRAWHYLGSNIAANLASEVFESLAAAQEKEQRETPQNHEVIRHLLSGETGDSPGQYPINERTEFRSTNFEAAVMRDFEILNDLVRDPKGLGVAVDRIVLYFDELNYCPSDRVMQVLEALRLFFSLPVFATVVAVDLRWLLWSIERHMPTIPAVEREEDPEAATHWSSTPWNYLEEIIQIPYVLPPLERAGYRHIIDSVVATSMNDPPRAREADQDRDEDYSEAHSANLLRDQVGFRDEGDGQPPVNSIGVSEPELASPELGQAETDFIKALAPVIATPRQAIHMVNLYRVFRISLDRTQLRGLLGTEDGKGEYQAVLLLFAVLTSFPILAVPLFKRVRQSDNDEVSWWKLVERLRPVSGSSAPSNAVQSMMTPAEAALWSELCDQLEEVRTSKESVGVDQLRPFRKWVLEVARFSIRTAHLVPRTADGGKNTH